MTSNVSQLVTWRIHPNQFLFSSWKLFTNHFSLFGNSYNIFQCCFRLYSWTDLLKIILFFLTWSGVFKPSRKLWSDWKRLPKKRWNQHFEFCFLFPQVWFDWRKVQVWCKQCLVCRFPFSLVWQVWQISNRQSFEWGSTARIAITQRIIFLSAVHVYGLT